MKCEQICTTDKLSVQCKKLLAKIHQHTLYMGYEALVATAIATSYSFLLLRHVGATRSLLAAKCHYVHTQTETLDRST